MVQSMYAVLEINSSQKWAKITVEGENIMIHSFQDQAPSSDSQYIMVT